MQQVDLERSSEERKEIKGKTIKDYGTLPKIRESAFAAVKGTKQGLPVPELEESRLEELISKALDQLEDSDKRDKTKSELIKIIESVYDILDNGRRDKSRVLPARTRKIITRVFSFIPISLYAVYALITGDFSLSVIVDLITGS